MSAVASVRNPAAVSLRRLCELEASREISRIGSSALDVTTVIQSIGYIALRVNGVKRIQMAYAESCGNVPAEALTWSATTWNTASDDSPVASAVASVAAGGQVWGELRLYFDLQPSALESPLRFAKFVGEQIAVQLDRWSLMTQADNLKIQTERLRKIIEKRKTLQRARAIIANSKQINDTDALKLMRRYAGETGRSLHQVAEALIFGDAQKWLQNSRYVNRKRSFNMFPIRAQRADH